MVRTLYTFLYLQTGIISATIIRCNVTVRLPTRRNFIMNFDDVLEGKAFVQVTGAGGMEYPRVQSKGFSWNYEIVGNPEEPLVLHVAGRNGGGWDFVPGVKFISGYQWDSSEPEVTRGYNQLE